MAKIMLVEDDNNLREIYEARLLAEGYQIVSAQDGEEALATAVREKPDLIISDVMMPKISGFDMLDILRSTPETKNTKVIMMTALSQAEDKTRAEKLGADKYLVKSQVTLEDVARVAREVLEGEGAPAAAASTSAATTPITPPAPTHAPIVAPTPMSVVTPPAPLPTAPVTPAPAPTVVEPPVAPATTASPVPPAPITPTPPTVTPPAPAPQPEPSAPAAPVPEPTPPVPEPKQISVVEAPVTTPPANPVTIAPTVPPKAPEQLQQESLADAPTPGGPDRKPEEGDDVPIAHKKIIQPINDVMRKPDIAALLAKEEANSGTQNPSADSVITPSGEVTKSPDAPIEPAAMAPMSATPASNPADPNAVAL